jgi:hypothetical protein
MHVPVLPLLALPIVKRICIGIKDGHKNFGLNLIQWSYP